MEKKGISTRLKNLMKHYVGRTFDAYFYGEHYFWTAKIVGLMGDTGYFETEVTSPGVSKPYRSNMSYGELTKGIKKNQYRELLTK